MTQSDFYSWIGAPVIKPKKLTGVLDGVFFYDADGKKGKDNGHVEIKNGEGEGLIYVEGDLHIKGQLIYRGLIYATGKITVDGKVWILGGIVAGKDLHVHSKKKEFAVRYSEDAIAYNIGRFNGRFETLSWRERA